VHWTIGLTGYIAHYRTIALKEEWTRVMVMVRGLIYSPLVQ